MHGACKLLRVLPGGFIVIVTLFLKVCGVGNKRVNIVQIGQILETGWTVVLVALTLTVK
jgi:hypothetical protein